MKLKQQCNIALVQFSESDDAHHVTDRAWRHSPAQP